MAGKRDTKKLINELADIIEKTDLTEIELEEDGIRIRVATTVKITQVAAPMQAQAPAPVASAPVEALGAPKDNKTNPNAVKSPMVGTVYLAPDPDTPNFISEGDTIKAGQTLFIVEAMKVMNPINSPKAGVIKTILVIDSDPVEFEQPLVIIE